MLGKQMGVKAREYCVLQLTAIHNTSAQIAKSPDICQMEGDGGCGWGVGLRAKDVLSLGV